jgi:hypothetical protein
MTRRQMVGLDAMMDQEMIAKNTNVSCLLMETV